MVVAGDEKLIALTRLSLAKNGLEVKAATTAYGALAELDASAHDLVILDTVLPDLSGWEVLRRIRGSSEVPVMLLTNRNSDVDKARGLDLGADDYLTKPFSFLEFEARVRALLRRARIAHPHQERFGSELHAGGRGPYRGDNRRAAAPRRSGSGRGPLRPGVRRVSCTVGGT